MRKRNLNSKSLPKDELMKGWISWYENLLEWINNEKKKIEEKLERLKNKEVIDVLSLHERELWSSLYHLEEKVERLREIGGPGVGGLQPKYLPHPVNKAETKGDYILMAMQKEIVQRYCEAMKSYVDGNFRACIFSLASLVEGVLKIELERRKVKVDRLTLGQTIQCCICKGVLPTKGKVINDLKFILKTRNDLIHFNLMKTKPLEVLGIKPDKNLHAHVSMESLPEKIRKCIVNKNEELKFLSHRQEEKTYVIYEYKKFLMWFTAN